MSVAVGVLLMAIGGIALLDGQRSTPSPTPAAAPISPSAEKADPPPSPEPATSPSVRSGMTISPLRLRAGSPDRLVITALGVDAPVTPIDMSDGILTPPGDPSTLGWWAAGAQPGAATGAALITGHTVHTGGGALDNLERLSPGDQIKVTTDAGRTPYVVRDVTIYRKKSLARDAGDLFAQTGPGRLVVVTCEDWDGTAYQSNVVVIAVPVGDTR